MNTNQKIKELIKKYKKLCHYPDKFKYQFSSHEIVEDLAALEALLEPCKHENKKLIASSKLNNETRVYNDYRCFDCNEIVKEILP